MNVLAVRELSKSFGGVRALRGVSFSVEAGELLAMIGPNGAGKSTCFNLINGQLRADAGEILFRESSILGRAPRELCRLGVGRSFQVAATFGSMSVRENVQVALLSHEKKLGSLLSSLGKSSERKAQEILMHTGMDPQSDRPCSELSYGDLKRVELAIALAARPRLMLMDEPTAGMAAGERRQLMALVQDIAKRENIAVLFTEHDMDVVFGYADRVLVLSEGELIAQGAPAVVHADPRVRQVYLGEEATHA